MKKEKNVSLHHHKKAAPDTKKYNQSVNRVLQQKLWPDQKMALNKGLLVNVCFVFLCGGVGVDRSDTNKKHRSTGY